MDESLDLPVAIVTGGAQGLGKALALALVNAGVYVVVVDINKTNGMRVVAELNGQELRAHFAEVDLSKECEIYDLIASTVEQLGRIDIIVNNARCHLPQNVFPMSMGSWDYAMAVMLKAPALLVEFALPYLIQSKQPTVVNISSTNATFVSEQSIVYSVAKAAMLQLTKNLAYELGPKGIRVNAIAPGLLELEDRTVPFTATPINKVIAEVVVPLGRAANTSEISDLLLFLISKAGSYITGQCLTIDGGLTLGCQFTSAKRALLSKRARAIENQN